MSKFATKLFVKAANARHNRAVGTLEYMLIAAVVVALAVVLRSTLGDVVSSLLGRVTEDTNTVNGTGIGGSIGG